MSPSYRKRREFVARILHGIWNTGDRKHVGYIRGIVSIRFWDLQPPLLIFVGMIVMWIVCYCRHGLYSITPSPISISILPSWVLKNVLNLFIKEMSPHQREKEYRREEEILIRASWRLPKQVVLDKVASKPESLLRLFHPTVLLPIGARFGAPW